MLLGLVFFVSLGKVKLYQQRAVEGHTRSPPGAPHPSYRRLVDFFVVVLFCLILLPARVFFTLFAHYLHLTAFGFGPQLADAYLLHDKGKSAVRSS